METKKMNYKNDVDEQYIALLNNILETGELKDTRSGQVISVFDRVMRFNLCPTFPVLTTKKIYLKGVIHELLWFLSGNTNIKYLVDNKVNIWNDDAYRYYLELLKYHNSICAKFGVSEYEPLNKEEFIEQVSKGSSVLILVKGDKLINYISYTFGDLGDVYGKQWRCYGVSGYDQINGIINQLKTNPDDRRMILTGWNPDVFGEIALPACHVFAVFNTSKLSAYERIKLLDEETHVYMSNSIKDLLTKCDEENIPTRKLNCSFTCRSQDVFLGTPFNISSYALLTSMIAQCVNMRPGELIWHGMDCHIYKSHIDAVTEQIGRDPYFCNLPKLELNPNITDIDKFTYDNIHIVGYESYPTIKAPLSVGLEKFN